MSIRSRLTYARVSLFEKAKVPVATRARKKRVQMFIASIALNPHDRVLDLGGSVDTWAMIDIPLNVTILNLPGHTHRKSAARHNISYVEGDACDVKEFSRGDFDVIFSNSVIEHVGPKDRQLAFAQQVLKFETRYWIQTPAIWFPIEAHCGMPFWWFYPQSWRQHFIRKWRDDLPDWTEMVEHTRCLKHGDLVAMFPEAKITTERLLGIPKSYIAWRGP